MGNTLNFLNQEEQGLLKRILSSNGEQTIPAEADHIFHSLWEKGFIESENPIRLRESLYWKPSRKTISLLKQLGISEQIINSRSIQYKIDYLDPSEVGFQKYLVGYMDIDRYLIPIDWHPNHQTQEAIKSLLTGNQQANSGNLADEIVTLRCQFILTNRERKQVIVNPDTAFFFYCENRIKASHPS